MKRVRRGDRGRLVIAGRGYRAPAGGAPAVVDRAGAADLDRSGRRRRDGRRLATQAAIDTCGAEGTQSTPRSAAAVLGVTEPFVRDRWRRVHGRSLAGDGRVTTIDHRERAPAAMRPDSFENGAPLPFNSARYSGLSVGVPGTVLGWSDAPERYGTISLAEALARRSGSHAKASSSTRSSSTRRRPTSTSSTTSGHGGALPRPGRHAARRGHGLPQPDLARTYERIAYLGAKGFYRGGGRGRLVETVQHPAVRPTANHIWRPA